MLESLRNAFFLKEKLVSSEPLQPFEVMIVYLNTMDLIHSVAKCLSEV